MAPKICVKRLKSINPGYGLSATLLMLLVLLDGGCFTIGCESSAVIWPEMVSLFWTKSLSKMVYPLYMNTHRKTRRIALILRAKLRRRRIIFLKKRLPKKMVS